VNPDEGWSPVADAAAVAPGLVAEASVAGHELVVWRRADGRPVVMDARCPHQWSHLGAEGAVDGDELVCLSHFWRFDPSGRGTKVNVKGRRDEKAAIPTFAAREHAGVIEARLDATNTTPADHVVS
jgi:phenylpropionate dioxygenase-like ring-hydroxylating dioxygenase large terminal subunit